MTHIATEPATRSPVTAEEAKEGPVVRGAKVYGQVPTDRAVQLLRRHAIEVPTTGPGLYVSTAQPWRGNVDVPVEDLVVEVFQPDTVVYWCGLHSPYDMAIVRGGEAKISIRLRHPGPPPDYHGSVPSMPPRVRWDCSAQFDWGNEDRPDGTPWVRTDLPEPDGIDRLAAMGADVDRMYDFDLARFLRDRGINPDAEYPVWLPAKDRDWYELLTMRLLAVPFAGEPGWRDRWRA